MPPDAPRCHPRNSELRSPERSSPADRARIITAGARVNQPAMTGLALMDMLLGHAYLTASQMTMAPFIRLNRFLLGAITASALVSIGSLLLGHPDRMFWNIHGLYLGTRWLVGILIAVLFVFMAHDCIKRRSTQSATGILYVAGVLICVGEIIGLLLLKETGLPL